MSTPVLAVDLGATSVRVCRIDLDRRPIECDVVHRSAHRPKRWPDGSLRWDWPAIVSTVEAGLRAGVESGPVASIGVDGWGVDYGLLDAHGELLGAPHSYRSERTCRWREVADRLGPAHLYELTGTQLININTLFQLAAEDKDVLDAAAHLLMVPELIAWHLTGEIAGEVTTAGTTGMLDANRREWCDDLAAAVGVRPAILPELRPAATPLGSWRGLPVHLVAGHDTASAVAALPRPKGREDRRVFVSTGTWILTGTVVPEPVTSAAAREANLSNEPAAFCGVRLLRNLTGLVLLERLREQWGSLPLDELMAEEASTTVGPVVNTDDPQLIGPGLIGPGDLEVRLRKAGDLPDGAGRAQVVRLVIDSLAARVSSVVDELAVVLGEPMGEVAVVGGGIRIEALVEEIGRVTGLPLTVGPTEASATGNALVQGVAIGRFGSLAEAQGRTYSEDQ